jgi:hypothetical protein
MLCPEDDWRDPRGGRTIDVHMSHTQHLKGRFDMKPTRTRLMGVAAALTTIAIAAPAPTAGAATAAPAGAPAPALVGPRYVTSAPSTFVNTNNQVSASNNTSGNQVAA